MIRLAALLAATSAQGLGAPAAAQDHSAHGMATPKPKSSPTPKPPAESPASPPAEPASQPHTMPGMDMGLPDKPEPAAGGTRATPHASHAGMEMGQDMETMSGMAETGTALPAGDATAPPVPTDHYADRFFPASEMERARNLGMREMGGQPFATVLFNIAEVQPRAGLEGFRWDGEGWFGGDINRLTVKSEGEGRFGGGVESAEVQALYSRAIGPYFNLQAGLRHDFSPIPTRTYATIGFEGFAPYMFEVEGALFVSPQGEVLGRVEGYYDQRITQRLILQPRIELNVALQDMPAQRLGSGLTNVEFGLRARYEITRRLAPYVGVNWEARTGRTADFARSDGEESSSIGMVAGIRFGF